MFTTMFILLGLQTVHFVADFVCQSDWMAVNKSKNWKALLLHTSVYSLLFMWWPTFALITLVAHTAQDALTSRINARLWAAEERHWFFVGIGADQLLHAWQLGLTTYWLLS